TGDLAGGDLLDQLGAADGQGRGRYLHAGQLGLERLQVRAELVGELPGPGGGVLLPQQVLEAVPAGEGRVVAALEVVDPGVDRPVDLLDERGDRLADVP